MNKLILKSLSLDNFAGSGKEEHNFFENETTVSADNGVGKTRLERAFKYLLFDKNEEDKKDFAIKNTKDLSLNRQESIVGGVLSVNGSDISLKKIYKEKWVKKQGSKTQEMSGNETEYFFNDVPVKKAEYNSKVDALINEEVFKLLTSISFFNKLPWTKQRSTILSLVPEVTDADVASTNEDFKALLASLTNGKTLAEYKTQISSQKKKFNDELKAIPVRIDEVRKSLPAVEDFEEIEIEIYDKETTIRGIEQDISGGQDQFNKLNEGRQTKQQIVNDLKAKKQKLEFELKQEEVRKTNEHTSAKVECRNNISTVEKQISTSEKEIKRLIAEIEKIDLQLVELRKSWETNNASEINFDEDNFKCPTCGTEKSAEEVESKKEALIEQFNTNKVTILNRITETGKSLAAVKTEFMQQLANVNRDHEDAFVDLEGYKAEFLRLAQLDTNNGNPVVTSPEITALEAEIATAEANIDVVEPIDQSELKEQKKVLATEIDALKLRLNNKNIIEAGNKRISELEEQESDYAQKVCDLENIEFTITDFDKAKINAVEGQINAKFECVKFKLFDTQVNGAEVPCCEAQIDGVPYGDTNTASKIVAGLDIIKTLSDHYEIYAPVFIDNSESISVVPAMTSQIIKLRVLEGQRTLLFS